MSGTKQSRENKIKLLVTIAAKKNILKGLFMIIEQLRFQTYFLIPKHA